MSLFIYILGLAGVAVVLKRRFVMELLKHIRYEVNYNGMALMSALADMMNRSKNRLDDVPSKKGEIAIVTGSSRGLGVHVAKGLAKTGMHVIIAVRGLESGEKIAKQIKDEKLLGTASVVRLDLSSMRSIEDFVKEVKVKYPVVHLLVNNAGILFGDFRLTEDGFESQLATNYLGHFYLTHLLLENLKKAGEQGKQYSRIVNVGSCAHYAGDINFDDINLKNNYHPTYGYARSKLAQMMSTSYLSRYFAAEKLPINIYTAHPGIVATDMFYDSPTTNGMTEWMGKYFKTPAEGAINVLFCGLSSTMEGRSGAYMSNCGDGYATGYSKKQTLQDRLFELSCQMLKINKFGKT